MRIIKIERDFTLQTTCIYDLTNKQVLCQLMTCDTHQVIGCLQEVRLPIDYIIIPINARYREAVYTLPCAAKPVIGREGFLTFLKSMVGEAFVDAIEEVAAEGENVSVVGPDVISFIAFFYGAATRDAAEACYYAWQRCIPTDDIFFYRVLRTLESYREELLSYFDMKEALVKAGEKFVYS